MSTPTHFAATIRARGKLPAVEVHGPICDRLLLPLARAASDEVAWMIGEFCGHRRRSTGHQLYRIRRMLSDAVATDYASFTAEPLTEAEHAARFPDEPETPMRGGWPVALFPDPQPATGA